MEIEEGRRPRSGAVEMPSSGPKDAVGERRGGVAERGRGRARFRRCGGEPSREWRQQTMVRGEWMRGTTARLLG
jgi:hypothetical protein